MLVSGRLLSQIIALFHPAPNLRLRGRLSRQIVPLFSATADPWLLRLLLPETRPLRPNSMLLAGILPLPYASASPGERKRCAPVRVWATLPVTHGFGIASLCVRRKIFLRVKPSVAVGNQDGDQPAVCIKSCQFGTVGRRRFRPKRPAVADFDKFLG